MGASVRRGVVLGALVAALCSAQVVAAGSGPAPRINRLAVFGDSLSDPGNVFLATREVEVRPFDPIPTAPYLIGRFHFTNGLTWIEQLAADLDLRRGARAALLLPGVFTNYAFGGARARNDSPSPSPTLATQIGLFLSDFGGRAARRSLYTLWIGSNDLRDAFEAYAVGMDPDEAAAIIGRAIAATGAGIRTLYAAGARSFLVLNQPNIGNTPAIRAAGPDAIALAALLSVQYNRALEEALVALEADPELDRIFIARFDVFAGFEELVADPALAGLTNVTDSCITPGVIIGAICRRPDKYLSWDFVHPTARTHEYIAEQVEEVVEAEFVIVPRFHHARPDGHPRRSGGWPTH